MRRPTEAGFTLIELIVVLVILAAVSALVVPKLAFVEAQAGNATAAAASAQLVSQLETSKLSTGSYPLGFDSALQITAVSPLDATPAALYGDLWSHPINVGPGSSAGIGPSFDLEMAVLTTAQATSLGHAFRKADGVVAVTASNPKGQGYYLYDHDPAPAGDPTNSAVHRRSFSSWSGQRVARVKVDPAPHLFNGASSWIKAAGWSTEVLPAGVSLVVFGIGSHLGNLGETMAAAPRHSEQDAAVYARYFAVFAVYDSGKPASLKAVLDSQSVSIEANVAAYVAAAPEHK